MVGRHCRAKVSPAKRPSAQRRRRRTDLYARSCASHQELTQRLHATSFRARVDTATLSHHRIKLFPASTSQADRLAQRLEPAPSPFKTRSLLSLEKSARKREAKAGERRVAESPTMKRLLRKPDAASARNAAETFKIPSAPSSRRTHAENEGVGGPLDATDAERPPRGVGNLDRSRPLPRGDSTAGATDVLKRRVVSLAKKPASRVNASRQAGSLPAHSAIHDDADASRVTNKRKRKSLSPESSCLHVSRYRLPR